MHRREQPPRFEQRVLDELILEKLRGAIDYALLLELETDLSLSVGRAMDGGGRRDDVTGELVCDLFQRGWGRLSEEILGDLQAREVMRDEEEEVGEVDDFDDQLGAIRGRA